MVPSLIFISEKEKHNFKVFLHILYWKLEIKLYGNSHRHLVFASKLSKCVILGFPCGSDGKEPACNEGDPGSIPGLGRSLEKEMTTHFSFLPGKFCRWRSLVGYNPWGCKVRFNWTTTTGHWNVSIIIQTFLFHLNVSPIWLLTILNWLYFFIFF